MHIHQKTVTREGLQIRQIDRLQEENGRSDDTTLVIFFSWLGATGKSLDNYFKLYHSLGYDILHVPGEVRHFAWPPTSVNLATVLLEYVCSEMTKYRYILVHSVSIGSYNYTSCVMEIWKHPQKYWNFFSRLVGNVFDSITFGSYDNMKTGVAYGLTKNDHVRILVQQCLSLYFALSKSVTVDFYEEGLKAFRDHPVRVPSIFYYCKNDPMCDHELIDIMVALWREKLNISVIGVCWETSFHSGHLYKHTQEYLENHRQFLQNVERYKSNLQVVNMSKL